MQLDIITLPDDLLWVNEFDWNPVEQSLDRSLTGALMVQEQALTFGRPIELTGGDEAGWVDRETVEKLLALSQIANKVMTLILPDQREYTVLFDRPAWKPSDRSSGSTLCLPNCPTLLLCTSKVNDSGYMIHYK